MRTDFKPLGSWDFAMRVDTDGAEARKPRNEPVKGARFSLEVAAAAKRLACYAFLMEAGFDDLGMRPEDLVRFVETLERCCELYEEGAT